MRLLRTDEPNRSNILERNKIIGYVEDGTLYGFDKNGFAVRICSIEHSTEAIAKFKEWQEKKPAPKVKRIRR